MNYVYPGSLPPRLTERTCVSVSRHGRVQHQKHVSERDVH